MNKTEDRPATLSRLQQLYHPTLVVSAVAALAFLSLLYYRLSFAPTYMWKNRDDAVITLSSARHFVDFGFLGVSPSGEMVEAFSAPLQALIYGLCYWVSAIEYDAFLSYQGFLSTLILGVLVGALLQLLLERPAMAIAASIATALFLLYGGNFIVWHFSGMENCLTHVAIVATIIYGVVISSPSKRPSPILGAVFAGVALTRIDLILEVGGILGMAGLLRYYCARKVDSLTFFAAFWTTWGALMLLKWLVFGSFLPHTASAQGIHPIDNILRILSVHGRAEVISLVMLMKERQMLLLSLVVTPLLLFQSRDRKVRAGVVLLYCAVGLALVRGLLFGGSRLDPVRTVSYLSVVQSVLLFVLLFSLRIRPGWNIAFAGIALLPVVASNFGSNILNACCDSTEFERLRCVATRIRDTHKITRPLLANPDLGAVSFHKEFNIYDFGRLANPGLTRLSTDEEKEFHFFVVVAPDIVEITPYWRERNTAVLYSPLFSKRYTRVSDFHQECNVAPVHEFYVRNEITLHADTRERALHDALHASLLLNRIEEELPLCSGTNPADCFYVARTIFRYLPELAASYSLKSLREAMTQSPASELFKRLVAARISSRTSTRWSAEYAGVIRDFIAWRHSSDGH